jgi:hypothetical protein
MNPSSSRPVPSVPDGTSACERVRDAFLAGGLPDDPELLVHAKTCEECSLLLADEGELGQVLAKAGPAAVAPKWASVGNAVRNERGLRAWVRSRPTRQRLLMVLVAALTALVLGGRRPRHDQPDGMALGVWVLVLLAATLVCAALALGSLGRLRSTGRRAVAIAVGALLPVGYALMQHTSGAAAASELLWPGILSCFGYGTLLVLPLFALIWLLDRDEKPALLGSVITGVAAGLAANAALSLHCAQKDTAHLLLGHAAIGAALGLVGAAFAALLARRRNRA